jgi:hypothetical protein
MYLVVLYVLSSMAPNDVEISFETDNRALFEFVKMNFSTGWGELTRPPMFQRALAEKCVGDLAPTAEDVQRENSDATTADCTWVSEHLAHVRKIRVKKGPLKVHCIEEPCKYSGIAIGFGSSDW